MKPWHRPDRRRASPIWLTIFSDMSTNLMMFFLMLYALTRMSPSEQLLMVEGLERAVIGKSVRVQADRKLLQEKEAIQRLDDTITYGKLRANAKMTVDDSAIKITLNLPVFFASGSAEIRPDTLQSLERLARPLKEFPNDIIIEGHTDNVPINNRFFHSNWELSVARAVSVTSFFIQRGLNPHKLIAGGYGEYHPAFPNDTEEHRALNRRIEITVVRPPREPL